jgi:hypothetical protein
MHGFITNHMQFEEKKKKSRITTKLKMNNKINCKNQNISLQTH